MSQSGIDYCIDIVKRIVEILPLLISHESAQRTHPSTQARCSSMNFYSGV